MAQPPGNLRRGQVQRRSARRRMVAAAGVDVRQVHHPEAVAGTGHPLRLQAADLAVPPGGAGTQPQVLHDDAREPLPLTSAGGHVPIGVTWGRPRRWRCKGWAAAVDTAISANAALNLAYDTRHSHPD